MSDLLLKRTFADIPIFEYGVVDSTQITARDLLNSGQIKKNSSQTGLVGVVSSLHQTGGRGRRSRTWQSEENSSYVWTFIVSRENNSDTQSVMGILTCIVQTLNKFGVNAKLKWPNDLIVSDENSYKKLGGTLSEIIDDDFLLVGVGINLKSNFFDDEIKDFAIALDQLGWNEELSFLDEVIERTLSVESKNVFDSYVSVLETIGKRVVVEQISHKIEGTAIDVNTDGSLSVKLDSGETIDVYEGDVVHLRNL